MRNNKIVFYIFLGFLLFLSLQLNLLGSFVYRKHSPSKFFNKKVIMRTGIASLNLQKRYYHVRFWVFWYPKIILKETSLEK